MRCLLAAILISVFVTVLNATPDAPEIPGFFLKIAKNIPRVGRRSDPLFMKSFKNIPRIGRSLENESHLNNNLLHWLHEDNPLSVEKRRLFSPATAALAAEREYSVVQPVNSNTLLELLEKDLFPVENVKFVHWKDFDIALQLDGELYAKVMSLGRAPDRRLKDDLNLRLGNLAPWFEKTAFEESPEFMSYDQNAAADKYKSDFLQYNHL